MPELKDALEHTNYYSSYSSKYNEKQIIAMIPSTTDFSFQDLRGDTFLDISINDKMPRLALALIATGKFDLGHVNKEGITALIKACFNKLKDVALALIKTGQSKPDAVDLNGGTALIYACLNKLQDVAIALINTGNANVNQKINLGTTGKYDALFFARKNNLTEVIDLLTKKKNDNGIDDSLLKDIASKFDSIENTTNYNNDDDEDGDKDGDEDETNKPISGGRQKKVRRTRKHKKITKRKYKSKRRIKHKSKTRKYRR